MNKKGERKGEEEEGVGRYSTSVRRIILKLGEAEG